MGRERVGVFRVQHERKLQGRARSCDPRGHRGCALRGSSLRGGVDVPVDRAGRGGWERCGGSLRARARSLSRRLGLRPLRSTLPTLRHPPRGLSGLRALSASASPRSRAASTPLTCLLYETSVRRLFCHEARPASPCRARSVPDVPPFAAPRVDSRSCPHPHATFTLSSNVSSNHRQHAAPRRHAGQRSTARSSAATSR